MGRDLYAVLGQVWELRLRHADQCEGNEMQFVRCHEACEFLQSGEATGKKLCNTAMQGLRLSTVLLLRHHSDAAEAEAIYVSCVSIPTLFLRSPQTSVDPKSRVRQADLAMRSVQRVNIQETRRCSRQRRSKSPDYETPEIVFMYRHVGVSSGDASRQNCRDQSDSPGHATCDCFYVYTSGCDFTRCVESQMQRPE